MQDVYRQPAELPREPDVATAAIAAPAPQTFATARADDADELSFVREGPYDASALDDAAPRHKLALAFGLAFGTTFATLLLILFAR